MTRTRTRTTDPQSVVSGIIMPRAVPGSVCRSKARSIQTLPKAQPEPDRGLGLGSGLCMGQRWAVAGADPPPKALYERRM